MRGSPPRMRGKGLRLMVLTLRSRDHPRVCGEKTALVTAIVRSMGSPPRMRGKAYRFPFPLPSLGITPAYAGKRLLPADFPVRLWDHPRVCGEKFAPRPASSRPSGSPPRMRGKAIFASCSMVRSGITPAYAGKRNRKRHQCRHGKDHPRVCGEKERTIRQRHTKAGSPPRMRGKD